MVLMLLAYAIGLGLGWLLWGREGKSTGQGKNG
jgi:hypothetical protein